MNPCSRCGFAGKINAWRIANAFRKVRIANAFRKVQVIVPCPRCGGRGRQTPPVIRTILWIRAVGSIWLRKAKRNYQVWQFKRHARRLTGR